MNPWNFEITNLPTTRKKQPRKYWVTYPCEKLESREKTFQFQLQFQTTSVLIFYFHLTVCLQHMASRIEYSEKYTDDSFEYR